MSIAPYPTSSVRSRSLVSVGALLASFAIGMAASGTGYVALAIPAIMGLCAVVALYAAVTALVAGRRSAASHSVAAPALLAAGSVVLIGWASRVFLGALLH
jgi:hypothetical protein